MKIYNLFFLLIVSVACSPKLEPLKKDFGSSPVPPSPNYQKREHWASLPDKSDGADSVPLKSNLKNEQSIAKADVFFIHPTIFIEKPVNQYSWNADVNDVSMNHQIQTSTILNQASVFNGSCRIYAPYYRQAHLYAFYTPNKSDASAALNLAYEDVKAAFEYYLKNFNQGRPIIIASHSQGSYHGERLLKDYFDGKGLQQQLVAAYLVGRAIKPTAFKQINPTASPDDIGTWTSWNTVGKNFLPNNYETIYKGSLSINPLLWNSSKTYASRELNKGGVAFKFTYRPKLVDAQNQDGILCVNRPHIKGSWLVKNKSWHRADYNFFYMNIRANVALRVDKFLQHQSALSK